MASQASSWKLYLQGDLGVGKTSFVRSLLRALGVAERIKSPSFALMHSYP
ncbi:MAG: bifunctional alanine racemase/tRNA (adenosine(37)-N6)-threonylcarbamoyltransferase complex ATPase subunit type 1 TsaE, partial [Betaproteobacteria bacterium]|nr:bifunctional alanine racemase/tRNA (adenosine(37)-N6)-threonylcarbamoyltransferase complex ATPase subunit type 1 TsaE [Betaproteobacteria bacterium]